MEKLQYDSKEYKLYSPDSLKYLTDRLTPIIIQKIQEYKKLFNIKEFRQLQINYFDELNKFQDFVKNLYDEEITLPEYCRATYDMGMINAYIEPNIQVDSFLYNDRLYMASHELFHIMYSEIVLKNDLSKRVVWYDEGMAQLFSGETDYLEDKESFKGFYLKVKEEIKEIPNLNNINHDENTFCIKELYNGYNLSYLAVKYLKEVLDEEEFKELLYDVEKVKQYGNILNDVFQYYDNKIVEKKR